MHIPVKLLPALIRRIADQFPGLQLAPLDARLFQPGPGIQIQIVICGSHRLPLLLELGIAVCAPRAHSDPFSAAGSESLQLLIPNS